MAARPGAVLVASSSFCFAFGSSRQGVEKAVVLESRGKRPAHVAVLRSKPTIALSASLLRDDVDESSTTTGELPKPCCSSNGPMSRRHTSLPA